jgi:predicted Zn-dependent peptidase
MLNYGKYGPKSAFTNIYSEKELNELKADDLVSTIKSLSSYKHHMLCYGSLDQGKVAGMLEKYHIAEATLKDYPAEKQFPELTNTENKVYVIDYDKKQVDLIMISKSENYMKDKIPMVRIFNEYFGGGMGSIVFQELRESKALAYTAYANFSSPNKKDRAHYIFSYIGTQVDKMPEAMKGMSDLINNMPEAPKNFEAAKNAVIKKIRTERITKGQVLFSYENARKLGLDYDIRMDVYKTVPTMTFAQLKEFQLQYLKDKKFTTLALGKKSALDIKTLEKYGKIEYLTLEDIFGY